MNPRYLIFRHKVSFGVRSRLTALSERRRPFLMEQQRPSIKSSFLRKCTSRCDGYAKNADLVEVMLSSSRCCLSISELGFLGGLCSALSTRAPPKLAKVLYAFRKDKVSVQVLFILRSRSLLLCFHIYNLLLHSHE